MQNRFQVRAPSAIMKVVYGKSAEGLSLTPVYLHHGSNLRITPCSNANRLNKPQVFVAAMFENVHIWASKSQLPWRLVFGTDTVISLPTGQVYQLAQELIKLMNSSLPMHSVLLVVLQITALIKDRIQSCQVVGVNCLKFKELTRLTPPNLFFFQSNLNKIILKLLEMKLIVLSLSELSFVLQLLTDK